MTNSKSYIIVGVFMVLSKLVLGQYHDANWVVSTGYASLNHNTLINFPPSGQPPQVTLTNGYIPFAHTNANISDQNGNLLFITNGINIFNRLFQPILGGIVQTNYTSMVASQGLNRPHQYIFLPWPGDTNRYVLFYCVPELQTVSSGSCSNGWSWLSTHLYYTVLDKTLNGGFGGIVSANNIALIDTLVHFTGLSAVKHANGRDWWLVVKENCNNSFKKVLFTVIGVQSISAQSIGPPMTQFDFSIANFSPNGNLYFQTKFDYDLILYKFDRCSGLFSDPLQINSGTTPQSYSAFSPNSRFLYRSSGPGAGIFTAQYDLSLYSQPNGVQNSRILIDPNNDSISCSGQGPYTGSTACAPELAANGKIYFGHCYPCNLSVINFPDSLDTLCNMEYNSFTLPSPHSGLPPYFPNYRLGPLVGSPCDTLSVGAEEWQASQVLIFPNPTQNSINVSLGRTCEEIQCNFYNMQGQFLFQEKRNFGNAFTLDIPKLSKGLYLLEILCNEGRVVKKVVVE